MKLRVGIVGAGIVGLSHAWSAAERGHDVTVFERTAHASGASIRNFGMVWPIGQPAGEWHQVALRSRERWLKLAEMSGIWANPCGSIHLAHREDEFLVLQEFAELGPKIGFDCRLLTATEVMALTPAANPQHLRGGLFSPTEVCVNPPATIRAIPGFLATQFGVKFEFRTSVVNIDGTTARSSNGRAWEFDRIIVCGGADLETLFPEVLENAGLKVCKLQMLKTRPQAGDWRIGPHLASGLTLRHYHNFDVCPSLAAVKQRVATETPELDRFGIHVMASQNNEGCVILGDSHEYDADIEPFDKTLIDDLILRELQKILVIPDWTIEERWHGIYAKYRAAPFFGAEPLPQVFVRTGTGGAGMTMSFGLAERDWSAWE